MAFLSGGLSKADFAAKSRDISHITCLQAALECVFAIWIVAYLSANFQSTLQTNQQSYSRMMEVKFFFVILN
jgi:hypothetical protein